MGVQPVTFSSAGQSSQHLIPGGFSRRNYIPSNGGGVSAGNVVILGDSRLGKPGELLIFSNASEAQSTLLSGDGLEGVIQAFDPGNDIVPQQIGFVRVNDGSEASTTLLNSEDEIIAMDSFDYGLPMNQIRRKFSAGTAASTYKVEVIYKGNSVTIDNIVRESFSILYSGSGDPATITITPTTLSTACTGSTDDNLTITLADFPTVEELVTYINGQTNYTATLLTADGTQLSTHLDSITGVSILSELDIKSNLQAVIEAFESIPYVTNVTFEHTSRILPDVDTDYVFFTGGTDGAYTTTEWNTVLSYLLEKDVQFISTPVVTEAIHILIKNHCVQASSVEGKAERQFYVGCDIGETVDEAIERSKNLNSMYGSLCYNGYYQYNDSRIKTLYSASYFACKQVGMLSALAINNPTTWKSFNILGWEYELTKSQLNSLIANGVLAGGKKPNGTLITVRSVTTFQGNLLQKNEASCMRESLYIDRDLRTTIENALTGTPILGVSSLSAVDTIFERKIQEWYNLGIVVKGADKPLYWGYTRTIVADAIYINYTCYIATPNNFQFTTSNHAIYAEAS